MLTLRFTFLLLAFMDSTAYVSTRYSTAAIKSDPCFVQNLFEFSLILQTDKYGSETSWELSSDSSDIQEGNSLKTIIDSSMGIYYAANTFFSIEKCLDPEVCYELTIRDSYGDGMCCNNGMGSYQVNYNGESIDAGGDFGSETSIQFGKCNDNDASSSPVSLVPSVSVVTSIPSFTMPSYAPSIGPPMIMSSDHPSIMPSDTPSIMSSDSFSNAPTKNIQNDNNNDEDTMIIACLNVCKTTHTKKKRRQLSLWKDLCSKPMCAGCDECSDLKPRCRKKKCEQIIDGPWSHKCQIFHCKACQECQQQD